MLPENRAFLIRGEDGQEYGPADLEELREWVRENRAGIGSEVRPDESGGQWQPWQNYPELVALLAEVHVTSAMPGQVVAPMGRRTLACVLDLILCMIASCPILFVIIGMEPPDLNDQIQQLFLQPQAPISTELFHYAVICDVVFYGMVILYMTGFQAAHGQTPAKALLHLKVVDQTGQKPRLVKCFVRGLIYVFSLYPFFIPFAYIYLVFNPQRRAFHDVVAGTYVVEA